MFKGKSGGTLASKIAHTTTIPALGNKDLKLLQDLITNEKTVLTSLQKLALDLTRASESLKNWGLGEGEDLGDVLSHATNIYAHISAALNNFANHEHTVRMHLKAIRSREEKLDETKRKRKSVASKADAADKKLSKMSAENKNLPAQTDLLNKLRDEIRQLDTEIMVEEARLGDFKRLSTRNFMSLKLGGLLEFGEKATIVGELGKLLIEEIPLDQTPPGQPRSFYQSHPKTENLDAEVSRCIGEVVFTPPPDIGDTASPATPYVPSDPLSQNRAEDEVPYPVQPTVGYSGSPEAMRAETLSDFGIPPQREGLGFGEFGEPGQGQRRFGSGPVRVGEDGAQRMASGGGGGQFSTFPVKTRPGNASGDPSFSASVANALGNPSLSPAEEPQTVPSVNVGGNPWNGEEYGGPQHARSASQDSSQLPYAAPEQGHQRTESRDALSAEKGVRFRTPSMVVSGMDPVAPGVASPVHPSAGWRGRAPASYDAPVEPVRPEPEVDTQGTYYSEDEYARNSAAAREVARELDSLHFAPPSSPHQEPPYSPPSYGPPSPTASLQPTRPLSINRAPSPLAPPVAPFAQPRSSSPNPTGSPRSASPAPQLNPRGAASLSPTGDGPTPYGTPLESPVPASGSTTSLTGGNGAPRTISAAAFKRTARSGSDVDVGKKRPLPSSPRPGPLRTATGGSMDTLGGGRGQLPPGAQPPEYFPPQEPGSPVQSDYGTLGNVRVANDDGGSPGYNQNKFVTHLED